MASNEISAEECEKFREVLETRCTSVENSPSRRKDSQSSIEREIAQLNMEMEQIQIECQEIVEAHSRAQQKIRSDPKRSEPFRSPRLVPRMGTKLEYAKQIIAAQDGHEPIWIKQHEQLSQARAEGNTAEQRLGGEDRDKEKDTSTTSAYNTGDSCRSTPLTLELNQSDEAGRPLNSMLSLGAAKPSHSDSEKNAQKTQNNNCSKEWNSDGDGKAGELSKSQSSGSVEKMSQTPILEERMDSLQDLYAQYADVMYTNHANLEHTIMVQQKLFQQQLVGKTHRRHMHTPHDVHEGGAVSVVQSPTLPPNSSSMEWVVKRRADGTRYITRRPVRNRMLKERAKKITEERTGMTTYDYAQSELKVGRYWSKEDRKRHLERAKDHKRRKEFMLKARMETLKEQEDTKKEPNIVELSHRKMMKHKGKKVFDDFTTVQEMLAHGSKMPEGKTYNPLLSVTTV